LHKTPAQLVVEYWPVIERLAQLLQQSYTLSGEEIKQRLPAIEMEATAGASA
jgi:hypothetical protein